MSCPDHSAAASSALEESPGVVNVKPIELELDLLLSVIRRISNAEQGISNYEGLFIIKNFNPN
jgi:hypothetical protein